MLRQRLCWQILAAYFLATGLAIQRQDSFKGGHRSVRKPLWELSGCYGLDCVERYAFLDDGAFAWTLLDQVRTDGCTKYIVELTSQTWLADAMDGQDGLWKHNLNVVVPDSLSSNPEQQTWATLFIHSAPWLAEQIAPRTGVVSVTVDNVPRENVVLSIDNRGPVDEETLKAYSWVAYAKDKTYPEWPIEVPGVKATVKAMDVVQALLAEHVPWKPPSKFIVSGASKRGAIAYLTGMVDPRVKGLIPVVMPLDVESAGHLREQSLGSGAKTVYDQERVTEFLVGEAHDRVNAIIAPIKYADRLKMPKLVLNVGNDNWFPPDETMLWWNRMPYPKSFYLYPNAAHGDIPQDGSVDFVDTIDAWVNGLVMKKQEPELDWTVDDISGEIIVRVLSNHTVSSVRLWKAVTHDGQTRNFQSVHWDAEDLDPSQRMWQVTPQPPPGRWQAILVSFTFPGPKEGGSEWRRSTEVSVMPKLLPFAYDSTEVVTMPASLSLPAFAVGLPGNSQAGVPPV